MRNDFTDLRTAIQKELTRRNITNPGDSYTLNPASSIPVMLQHFAQIITDCHAINPNQALSINSNRIVNTPDIDKVIAYIQTLENQILVS